MCELGGYNESGTPSGAACPALDGALVASMKPVSRITSRLSMDHSFIGKADHLCDPQSALIGIEQPGMTGIITHVIPTGSVTRDGMISTGDGTAHRLVEIG
jgi:hypothetical protein